MAGLMRGKGNQTMVWILLGLLILGLTGFGIGSFSGGSLRNIGSVGDQEISIDEYAQQMNQTLQGVTRQIGRSLTATEIESSGIQRAVLSEVVAAASLDNEAANLGISVGDEAVLLEIMATPGFQSLAGTFDAQAYEFTLERSGLTATQYEDSVRRQTARTLLQGAVVAGVDAGDSLPETFVKFAGEARSFDWAELTADYLITPVGIPTEDQLVEQYELNPQAYTAPLTREITYVWLSPNDLIDQVDLSEAELREQYEINSERYNRPARRAVDRIVFGTDDAAMAALARLNAGDTDFDALAEERGLTLNDIDQGEVERTDVSAEVGDLIFDAQDTGIVGPAQTDLGPALFRINAIFDEAITSFEAAEPELREELASEQTATLVLNQMPEIDDLLAAGATLEELANDTNMVLGTISFDAGSAEGIAAYEEFRDAANQASEGDFPELLALSDGGVFALRVDQIVQPALIPLDEIRDQVNRDWTASETVRRLTQMAAGFAARLTETSDFGGLGISAVQETEVQRTGFVEGTPPSLVTELFEVDQGGTVVVADLNSVFLAQVTAIQPYDLTAEDAQQTLARIKTQLNQQIAEDLLSAYTQAVQNKAGVTLNQNAINAVNAQMTGGVPHQ